MVKIYTRAGDDGSTGLWYGGRVAKSDARPEAYGAVDEAASALGLCRAAAGGDQELAADLLRMQHELFVVGAELATHIDRRGRLADAVSRVTPAMVAALEVEIDSLEKLVEQPKEFVLPGETLAGAALDLARTTVRRAERRSVALSDAGELPDSQVGPYLNRLADLLFVMARAADGGFRAVRD